MTRPTVAACMARIDALQEELDALKATIARPATPVQYFPAPGEKWHGPEPISEPLEVQELAATVSWQHSHYIEENDVYRYGAYI